MEEYSFNSKNEKEKLRADTLIIFTFTCSEICDLHF